jgi:diaminopimelate epimerase
MSAKLVVSKIVGTGNDFVFIDARSPLPAEFASRSRPELVRQICERHFGIGADGVVFVEPGTSAASLAWDFYNSDGSEAEMCGNASRCMGRWAQKRLGLKSVVFQTKAGAVRAVGEGENIESHLNYMKLRFDVLEYEVGGIRKVADFVNTGVPHAVVRLDRIEDARSAKADIDALRFHPAAGPRGTNVTFYAPDYAPYTSGAPASFQTVTFERGVEGFTLSCGTGVLAAAAIGLRGTGFNEAKLTTPGGPLQVSYGQNFEGAVLKGPANFLFETTLTEEFFR